MVNLTVDNLMECSVCNETNGFQLYEIGQTGYCACGEHVYWVEYYTHCLNCGFQELNSSSKKLNILEHRISRHIDQLRGE